MTKSIKEGTTYNLRDMMDFLTEFSAFKDRVEKKFKDVARELDNKQNEHDLWVSLFLIATDYSEEIITKKFKQEPATQKVS